MFSAVEGFIVYKFARGPRRAQSSSVPGESQERGATEVPGRVPPGPTGGADHGPGDSPNALSLF